MSTIGQILFDSGQEMLGKGVTAWGIGFGIRLYRDDGPRDDGPPYAIHYVVI